MIRLTVTLPLSSITTPLHLLPTKLDALMAAVIERQASVSTGYMKSNAPWHDRTGNARSGLHAQPEHAHLDHSLVLAHGVPYGIWLELRFAGRNAIIMKSVQAGATEVMALLDRGMSRL